MAARDGRRAILLISASHYERGGCVARVERYWTSGLTLVHLEALTPGDFICELVDDFRREPPRDTDADLVGITAMGLQIGRAYDLAERYRARGLPVVMGGEWVSLNRAAAALFSRSASRRSSSRTSTGSTSRGPAPASLDDDDPADFDRTLEFLIRHKVPLAKFHLPIPCPGTPFYNRMEKEGRILTKDWNRYHYGSAVIRPKRMTPEMAEQKFWGDLPRLLQHAFDPAPLLPARPTQPQAPDALPDREPHLQEDAADREAPVPLLAQAQSRASSGAGAVTPRSRLRRVMARTERCLTSLTPSTVAPGRNRAAAR